MVRDKSVCSVIHFVSLLEAQSSLFDLVRG